MKLEITDQVEINNQFTVFNGKKGKVINIHENTNIDVEFENGKFQTFNHWEVKLITHKQFTLEDFQDGMKITHRDGVVTTFFECNFIYTYEDYVYTKINISNYNDDLTAKNMNEYDIIQIKQNNNLLFNRKETKRYTVGTSGSKHVILDKDDNNEIILRLNLEDNAKTIANILNDDLELKR